MARTKWAKSIEYIECQKFDDHNKDERLNLSKIVSKTISKTVSTVSKQSYYSLYSLDQSSIWIPDMTSNLEVSEKD